MEIGCNLVIGKKQILRLLKENKLRYIQIATDCDEEYSRSLVSAAKQNGVETEFRGTMQEIATTYGKEVPCGAVGFLKND